jgi:hypothetical protein
MTTTLAPLPSPETPVQRLIRQLGHGGLVPFVGLCLLAWLVNEAALPYVALALVAYAALIASFLGGLHWAVVWLAEAGALQPRLSDDAARQHLIWGVLPSLLAWPGVLMPAYAALPWLGCVLIACYVMDRRLYPASGLGHWLTLRFRLSVVAALSCFLAAGAV